MQAAAGEADLLLAADLQRLPAARAVLSNDSDFAVFANCRSVCPLIGLDLRKSEYCH